MCGGPGDDKADEAGFPLRFFLDYITTGITVLSLNEATGDISFCACESGVVGYRSTRDGTDLSSYGFLTITVNGSCDTVADSPDSESKTVDAAYVSGEALLPNTGASSNLKLLGAIAVMMLASGIGLVGASRGQGVTE